MMNHLARRGGTWWARLVVPAQLRQAVGRREFTKSTRTHELHVAKLVAAVMVADWRKQLMRLEARDMNPIVLNLLQPAPALDVGGTLSIDQASKLGVERESLLRIAAAGRLVLHCRLGAVRGYMVKVAAFKPDATGEREIPPTRYLPDDSIETLQSGVLALPDSKELANAVLGEGLDMLRIIALQVPGDRKHYFVPANPVETEVGRLEVPAGAVRKIREHLAARLSPDQVERAYKHEGAAAAAPGSPVSRRGSALFSQAVEAYCTDPSGLPSDLASSAEQRQRRAGMMVFAEFMGDLPLADIDANMLRSFRDGPLRTLPAKTNNLPKPLRRATMSDTIKAIADAGVEWPLMSTDMQQERMRWLARLFAWLHQKEWLATNPALPLKGETGLTKVQQIERQLAARENKSVRVEFTPAELKLIFGQSCFATGSGAQFAKPRFWYPFEYWLPLLGLYAGCRHKEASQLHLADVRQEDGVWVLDINQSSIDKKLKNLEQTVRKVPLHPRLIELGFLTYCKRLGNEGYRRVFPELTWARSDARYAKEPIRKMSQMLKSLGFERDGTKVFHSLRHNLNNALARVPISALPHADEHLRKFIRYTIMGHDLGKDVNTTHYMNTPMSERQAMVAAVHYDLPPIASLDIDFAVQQVKKALENKSGARRGREDMGPLNTGPTSQSSSAD